MLEYVSLITGKLFDNKYLAGVSIVVGIYIHSLNVRVSELEDKFYNCVSKYPNQVMTNKTQPATRGLALHFVTRGANPSPLRGV